MKKFLILGALVAGLAFLGTAGTAEAGHGRGYDRGSCHSRGYGYGSYSPSRYSRSYSSGWGNYRRGGYYGPSRHDNGYGGHQRSRGHGRSNFGLHFSNGRFGISIHR